MSTTPVPPVTGEPAATPTTTWTAFIKPFADAIGKTTDEVTDALKSQIGEPTAESIDLLKSDEFVSFEDIKAAFTGVPVAKLKKAVKDHLRAPVVTPTAATPPVAAMTTPSAFILPQPPDDRSWLEMLKTGGELKPNQSVVISGIRAALAGRTGLYDVPNQLVKRMEEFADSLNEPVGNDFFRLRNLLTTRNYGDIFAAIPGVNGTFATQGRKNSFLERLDTVMWPSLSSFHGQLKNWAESWQTGLSNPAMMMGVMASVMGGGAALPAGMLAPPNTDGLRDAAESVINEINKCFGGTSIPVAMALAYDAQQIKEVLENPQLPSQIGAANRDLMLKMLNVAVPADYVRLERNVTQYTLAVMELGKTTGGQHELGYLQALLMLGQQIPWEKLAAPGRRTPITRRNTRTGDEDESNRY